MAEQVSQRYENTTIPDYARPYVENLLGQSAALTDLEMNPFMQYMGDRQAQFSPLQNKAFESAQGLQTAPQLQSATNTANLASQAALNYGGYNPGVFSAFTAQNPDLNFYQAGPVSSVTGSQMSTPTMATAQSNFNPTLQQYQMSPSIGITTDSFTGPNAQKDYMSPYMTQVVERQQADAQRQADIARQSQGAQAARSGAFGGSGDTLMRGQLASNLARQKGDIFAQGQQTAFQQAQQQFNQEQAARLQANMANQQAGLQTGGQNLQAMLSTQQLGTQTGLQTALANLSASQQANVQNQAAHLQTQGLNAQQAMQAALANQQTEMGLSGQNLQAKLGVQQFGAGQDMQAQLANQQQLMQAQQLAEQSRQFGAGLGLQGLQTALTGAGQLGNLGQNQYNQEVGIASLQNQFGGQQQQQVQGMLNTQYQDFLNSQNYPYKQLGFMSDMLRGLPLTQQASTLYQPAPSTGSQLLGAATSLGGAYLMGGRKEGGMVSSYAKGGSVNSRPAGLAELALSRMA
jgi:hypothetical protein